MHEGSPHLVEALENGQIQLVINTPLGRISHEDDAVIRQTALNQDIPCATTLSGAVALAEAIACAQRDQWEVHALQHLYETRSIEFDPMRRSIHRYA